jgi:hypothetical protein
MSTDFRTRIDQELVGLGLAAQQKVLEYVRALKKTGDSSNLVGTSGSTIAAFAGTILADDLQAIELAIEQGCERVDKNEW